MTFWDFVVVAFYVTGAWLSQNWFILFAMVVLGGIVGWVCYEWRNAPLEEPTLSQSALPPSLFPAWYKAEDEAEMIADACMAEYEGFDNPS